MKYIPKIEIADVSKDIGMFKLNSRVFHLPNNKLNPKDKFYCGICSPDYHKRIGLFIDESVKCNPTITLDTKKVGERQDYLDEHNQQQIKICYP